ncbi:transposase [Bifidobacterium longum subsp. longum]|uniref:Transposase n=3 Tax=Bifidobacterium longum TaxID=216816 RepID=A0A9Q8VI54_BIFLL|nr:transposase [Bifidobacterium longum subsp. longum]UNL67966.1 transposase [Bifidobacterium longum subsp. longum]UNL69972.1 transposase [Bifidobacterium longum subsp. longum]UNL71781.1 transposase [Bifidobacterium longum subsp. longum]UNL82324.1 transposase [Bifidobacterium longum subsp. longum]
MTKNNMLARRRAKQLPTATAPGSGLTDMPGRASGRPRHSPPPGGRYGYRRVKAALRTRVSEKVLRRIMAEDGLTAHVPERRGYGSYEGETTPAPGNLADRDFTAGMPNGKWPADITRDQGQGREGRASRRRSTATTAGSSRTRPVPVPTPGLPTGCSSGPWKRCRRERIPWCVPTADDTAGGPDGWRSWTATA